ncbi:MAG: S8/S53 family peptidase, partial [Polyangiaceae bacterium]
MRNAASSLALLSILSSLIGCHPPDESTDPDDSDLAEARSALEAPACGGRRWVSLGDPGACVSQAGFDAEPLFPPAEGPPPALAGYCVHTWTGTGAPSTSELEGWEDLFAPGTLAEDCALVTPLGGYSDHLGSFLRQSIKSRVGVVTGAPVAAPLVHVAVLDTTPDAPSGVPELGLNRHGDTLAALIGEVVNVPGAAGVSTSLAMPYITDASSGEAIVRPGGGDFGYISDLARALWRTVRYHHAAHVGERLVLNMSLGWESLGPSSACGGAALPAASAVRDVLDIAACQHDALIVAAAGNDTGGPAPASGLMCPAAWMTVSPSCAPGRPLVIAAFGLDYADRPLAVGRHASATPFAAPSLGGIAWSAGSPMPPPLTGTSVASAAVSASIAAVWANAPYLPPEVVLQVLHDASPPVSLPVSVCAAGAGACDMRRLSPCGALSMFGSPWTCAVSTAQVPLSNPGLDPMTQASMLSAAAGAQVVFASATTGPLASQLGATAAGQNLVHPQPIIPVCPTCTVSLGSGSAASNPSIYGRIERPVTGLAVVLRIDESSASYALSGVTGATPFRATLPATAASARAAWI